MAIETKKKLVTADSVTMTGCLNAIHKLRNCATCPLRFDKEKCKAQKCVPKVVIDRIELAVREHFYQEKLFLMKNSSTKEEHAVKAASSGIEKLQI